ncbi:MAG: metallophosphoesterase, partial [Acidiferrobacter sp.]
HIGSMNGRRRVRTMIRRLEESRPDVVVSTGDFIDSRVGLLAPVTELLAALRPPLGKFAVVGNHECYAGLGPSLTFMERCGFTVLRNNAVSVHGVRLVGMDDPMVGQHEHLARRETQVLRQLPERAFTILLKHRPDLVPDSQARFDLQLSGHTHKGQMFPLGFLTRLYYPAHAGLFRLAQTSYLYVSRGTGAWGPPFRLFAPPEITIFTIGPGRPDPGGQAVPQVRRDKRAGGSEPEASVTAYVAPASGRTP